MAIKWTAYINGALNITAEELENMTGNELSIFQYATELRMKNEQYTIANGVSLLFGGKEG